MPALNFLGNLGAIGGGYISAQDQLQQQQYRQILVALAAQQMQQQQQKLNASSGAFQALQSPAFQDMFGQGQQPQMPQPQQAQQPPALPPVPDATAQMGAGPGLVRGSEFGNDPTLGWTDRSDSGLMASGLPVTAGGIALPSRATLGQQFDVTAPSGQSGRFTQTDIGPAKWTGRGVDFTPKAAQALGYKDQASFPTDAMFRVVAAKNDLTQSIPQDLHQPGLAGASNTFRALGGSPLQFVNRFDDPGKLAQVISQANPQADDQTKMAIFDKLYPLLSNAGKVQFAQAWDMYKEGTRESEFQQSKDLQQRDFDVRMAETKAQHESIDAFRQQQLDIEKARLEREKAGGGGHFGDINDLMTKWHQDYIQQNKKEPSTEEVASARRDFANNIKPPSMSQSQIATRLRIAANDVTKTVTAMTELGPGATLGIFGGAQSKLTGDPVGNMSKALLNKVTPETSQLMSTLGNGLGRALAILAAGGSAQGLVGLSDQLAKDVPAAGDTGTNVLLKFADMRQIADAAMEVMEHDPRITDDQKAHMATVAEQLHKAVPFTTADVIKLSAGADHETIRDFAAKLGLIGGGSSGTPARQLPDFKTMTNEQIQDYLRTLPQ